VSEKRYGHCQLGAKRRARSETHHPASSSYTRATLLHPRYTQLKMHSAALRSFYGSIRSFHRSRNVAFPRQVGTSAPPLLQKTGMLFDEDGDVDSEVDNSEGTSAGHLYLQQQRQILSVMRLIEHDMPKLVRTLSFHQLLLANYLLTRQQIHRMARAIYTSTCRSRLGCAHHRLWRRGASCNIETYSSGPSRAPSSDDGGCHPQLQIAGG
jgi:hypothetical protein